MSESTRSQQAFSKAKPEIQKLVQRLLQDERAVQHHKRRILLNGEGIHEAILRHIKEAAKRSSRS
jgi:hypothetical protein